MRLLEAYGYVAVPAINGDEALLLIASGPEMDLVVADIAMPEMTGTELARTIYSRHPALPIILVTGSRNRNVLKHFGEAQILRKPYADRELVARITKALS